MEQPRVLDGSVLTWGTNLSLGQLLKLKKALKLSSCPLHKIFLKHLNTVRSVGYCETKGTLLLLYLSNVLNYLITKSKLHSPTLCLETHQMKAKP